jgi:glyoxylase-like metal-dependent hydrolase (beta-lactamase superfamily II)
MTASTVLPGVHRLGSALVNWYLVEDEGRLTAIDAGLPGFRRQLEAYLESLGRRLGDVEAVVLTHSDSDHTGLAPTLREAGARVLIHEADEDTLRRPRAKTGDGSPIHLVPHLWRPQLWQLVFHLARAGGLKPPKIEGAETFAGGDVLDVPGRPVAFHTPGHTAGLCAIHFERQGALFVGDALCTWNPLTGRLGPQVMPSALNVNTDDCFESLGVIAGLDAQAVLVGHGEPWLDSPAAAVARARELGRS